MHSKLIFNSVPKTWEEFLPLGNGRLGAMVKAGINNEVYQLNEEGIWSGGPQNRINPDSMHNLEKIRKLVKNGNVLDAQELALQSLSGTSFNERVYQPAGDFKIDFFDSDSFGIECGWPLEHKTCEKSKQTYKSVLNLQDAFTEITYQNDKGVSFWRKSWISAKEDAIFIHVKASAPAAINFRGFLDRGHWSDNTFAHEDCIFLEDSHGIPFCVGVGAVGKGGKIKTNGVCLTGFDCDEVLLFIDIRTWKPKNNKVLLKKKYDKSILKNYWKKQVQNHLWQIKQKFENNDFSECVAKVFNDHLQEYHSYWTRSSLCIGQSDELKAAENYSEKVLENQVIKNANANDVFLVNLYANFSKYLLISASRRPGYLPANLQGLWNCYMDPPWGSKYTVNINAQMNYWPVNISNLSECEIPLFNLLERAYENGKIVAKKMYNCNGYVIHHNLDFWGDSAPQDSWLPGTYWVLGAAWLSTHIWDHFEYTQDFNFLERYYYLIHEACRFFVDFLQPSDMLHSDGNPYLVLNPSVSPENSYVTKAGQVGAICEGCQMDNMILRHLFVSCLKAKSVLQNHQSKKIKKIVSAASSDDFKKFEYVLNHLKKPELNSDGSLMEWNCEVEEVEPGHRHISHLYGLFPGHDICVQRTPELAEGAKRTLQKRLSNGGGHTGWSQAWIINFRAQLEQGDLALDSIVKLLRNSTLPNLLDNHPPFQIDGNFGALAGIERMLVQSEFSENDEVIVKLLPALPSEKSWQSGFVKGLCIKGGYSIDFSWENGKVKKYELHKNTFAIEESRVKIDLNL